MLFFSQVEIPILFLTITGSPLEPSARFFPKSVSPKIQTSRSSGSGMEYAASAPCQVGVNGNDGMQPPLLPAKAFVGSKDKQAKNEIAVRRINARVCLFCITCLQRD